MSERFENTQKDPFYIFYCAETEKIYQQLTEDTFDFLDNCKSFFTELLKPHKQIAIQMLLHELVAMHAASCGKTVDEVLNDILNMEAFAQNFGDRGELDG